MKRFIERQTANGQSEGAKTADKVEDGGPLDDFLDWIGLMGGGSGGLKNFSTAAGRVEDFSAAAQNGANAIRRISGGISGKTGNGVDTIINFKNDGGYGRRVIFKVDTGQYKSSGEGDYMIRK